MDERRRHMETAYRIDLLARIGITLMLLSAADGLLGLFLLWRDGLVLCGSSFWEFTDRSNGFLLSRNRSGITLGKIVEIFDIFKSDFYLVLAVWVCLILVQLMFLGDIGISKNGSFRSYVIIVLVVAFCYA